MAYNRTKEIFEAVEARDAVLLNEILENMNGGRGAAVKNGDLDVKVLFKHNLHIGVPFREGLFWSAVKGNTDILRYFIENKADIDARIKRTSLDPSDGGEYVWSHKCC